MQILSLAKRIKMIFLLRVKSSLFSYRFRDQFYDFQQAKLRGSRTEIKSRQLVYLPYLKKVNLKTRKTFPFLDCGFGRGEFLELVREKKLAEATGVDINALFVRQAKKAGLQVYHGEMISHLYLNDRQYSGISAFHVIEHLTFDQLFDFLLLAHTRLAPGGVLILETPNVENLIVSSTSFYYDHTHTQKVPRQFIATLLDFLGFSSLTFLPLSPIKTKPHGRFEQFLFGAQDMGIVAYKR